MTRRLRLHVPGGFYHVTLRGNHQQAIFRLPADRQLLNAIVARSLERHAARLHAYCWMSNHLHFFVQVGDSPLGSLMRDIASNYARAFQAKLETSGHLFERRYHAQLVDIDAYLFAVLRYIHLNPVDAQLVRTAAQYRWSSHRAYAGLATPESWLEIDFCLGMFARERQQAQAAYRRFIQQAAPPVECDMLDSEADVLGDDSFVAGLNPAATRTRSNGQTLADVVQEACRRFDIQESALMSRSREAQIIAARAWVARQSIQRGIATLSEVARGLGRDRATLRHAMRAYAHADSTSDIPA